MSRNFEKLGIKGWKGIEPAVLATIGADKAVLFIGPHGTNKTEGAIRISKALLGDEANFAKYDVPIVQTEDILGILDPNSLKEGRVEYLKTPLSIWNQDSILLDEFNRTSMFSQSKLMEIVRAKSVMGIKLPRLKIVFSAINPPEEYNSGYMDLAVASRFYCFQVTDEDLTDEEILSIIMNGNEDEEEGCDVNLRQVVSDMLAWSFSKDQLESIGNFIKTIRSTMKRLKIYWSPRQARDLYCIMKNLVALSCIGEYEIDKNDVLCCVTASIPQLHGIVATEDVDRKTEVEKTLMGECMKFANTLSYYKVEDCVSYAGKQSKDDLLWASELTVMLEKEENDAKLKKVENIINNRMSAKTISVDSFKKISTILKKKKVLGVFVSHQDEVADINKLSRLVGNKEYPFVRDDSRKMGKIVKTEEQSVLDDIIESSLKESHKEEDSVFEG